MIYLEDIYEENLYTLQGNNVHQKAHEEASKERSGIRTETALPVWSNRLGVRGQADLVEFHLDKSAEDDKYKKVVPVEYKRGVKKKKRADEIQLCAQSLCLEEMFNGTVNEAYIYHHSSQARREVELNTSLRQSTKEAITSVRKMLIERNVPEPVNDNRCDNCSLKGSCMPGFVASH